MSYFDKKYAILGTKTETCTFTIFCMNYSIYNVFTCMNSPGNKQDFRVLQSGQPCFNPPACSASQFAMTRACKPAQTWFACSSSCSDDSVEPSPRPSSPVKRVVPCVPVSMSCPRLLAAWQPPQAVSNPVYGRVHLIIGFCEPRADS